MPLFSFPDAKDTEGRALTLIVLERTLSAAQGVFDAVPECGGVVTGDTCSGVASSAKIILFAVVIGLQLVSPR
jgi:hypothetical protein